MCSKYVNQIISADSCEERLQKSFECYQDQVKRFNQSPANQKQEEGCRMITNLVNCCDRILCTPPDRDNSIKEYAEYVKAIYGSFDLSKCEGLI